MEAGASTTKTKQELRLKGTGSEDITLFPALFPTVGEGTDDDEHYFTSRH